MLEREKYRVLRPIAVKGDRVEAGTVLELTQEDADNLNPAHIQKEAAAVEAEAVEKAAEATKPIEGSEIDI
jgi:hypothetical protein